MVQKSGINVKDILLLDCMQKTKVLAGEKGLARIITDVNVMEVPDIIDWVKEGSLLLTTAYSIHNDLDALYKLIDSLAAKGLAGLAIKTKRYIDNIPSQIIGLADSLNFPILELPFEASFSDIINGVLSELLQYQTGYLKKSEEAHLLFMEVILKGGSMEGLAQTLAELVGNSIVIYNSIGEILAKKLISIDEETFNQILETKRTTQTDYIDPLNSGVNYTRIQLSINPQIREFKTQIAGRDRILGYLAVYDTEHTLTQNDFIFINRATTFFALEIINQHTQMEVERRYRNEFLNEILKDPDGVIDSNIMIERARYLGWNLALNYIAFVFEIDDLTAVINEHHQNEQAILEMKESLFKTITSAIKHDEVYLAGTESDSIILFLAELPELKSQKKIKEHFARRAEELLNATQSINLTVSLGVGRFYTGIEGMRKSYYEAHKALFIRKNILVEQKIVYFDHLGIYRILHQINDMKDLISFYQETILPLDNQDKNYATNLVKTLTEFYNFNGNLKSISKSMYIHYNTILYRIERIEQLTGLSLDNSEHRLNLQVGLIIRNILLGRKIIT